MNPKQNVLFIGPRGNFGSAVLAALAQSERFHIAVMQRPGREPIAGFDNRFGDASRLDDLMEGTAGIDIVVYGFHAGYVGWETTLLPAAENMAQVAIERQLRLVYPGNVYGLDPSESQPMNERAPRRAVTEKGRIRNQIEGLFEQSCQRGATTLIVRAGDFFGPGSKNTWLDFFTKGAKSGGALTCPETAPVLHSWAYLPDLGRTIVALLEREAELPACARYHFRGHELTPMEMMEACSELLGGRRIKGTPWWALRVAAVFSPLIREILPMRYLWQQQVLLDDSQLKETLGVVPFTALHEALRATLNRPDIERAAA